MTYTHYNISVLHIAKIGSFILLIATMKALMISLQR